MPKCLAADNGQYSLAGKGAWPMLCGEEMRTGLGSGGQGWRREFLWFVSPLGFISRRVPGPPALTRASCPGSLPVACIQSPASFLLVIHVFFLFLASPPAWTLHLPSQSSEMSWVLLSGEAAAQAGKSKSWSLLCELDPSEDPG